MSQKGAFMKRQDWAQKLTSRKFWAAIAEFVVMLIVALGASESTAAQVSAIIMAGAAVVAYIIGEGLADAAGASQPMIIQQQPPEEGEVEGNG